MLLQFRVLDCTRLANPAIILETENKQDDYLFVLLPSAPDHFQLLHTITNNQSYP
jgi:hypothetical protein